MSKLIVGLTGGFGTGKTTVGHFFEELGAEVLSADRIAHEALLEGSEVYPEIVKLFPDALSFLRKQESRDLGPRLRGDDNINKKKLAEIIFSDAKRRKKLESLIHPYVMERMSEEIADSESPVIVLEVPLLYEAGFERLCDRVVVVSAPEDVILRRLQEKGFSPAEIGARAKAQLPLQEKIKKADYVIHNSGTLEETRRQAEKIWKDLRAVLKGEK